MKRFSMRKWGWWLVLWDDRRFKIKLLRFNALTECSMQRHKYRGELWLFLRGDGLFKRGKEISTSFAGDYRFVAPGTWHQFVCQMATWVLEIQYGKRCEEDDITRA